MVKWKQFNKFGVFVVCTKIAVEEVENEQIWDIFW